MHWDSPLLEHLVRSPLWGAFVGTLVTAVAFSSGSRPLLAWRLTLITGCCYSIYGALWLLFLVFAPRVGFAKHFVTAGAYMALFSIMCGAVFLLNWRNKRRSGDADPEVFD